MSKAGWLEGGCFFFWWQAAAKWPRLPQCIACRSGGVLCTGPAGADRPRNTGVENRFPCMMTGYTMSPKGGRGCLGEHLSEVRDAS